MQAALGRGSVVRSSDRSAFAAARADIVSGLLRWRLWGRLGWNDIRQRYQRSILGPLWLTVSMGILIGSLGLLYARLFQQPVEEFLPYCGVGLLIWGFMSSYLTESGTLFSGAEAYIKQISLPFSLYVYRASWAKRIMLAHNFIIYFGIIVYFHIWPGAAALLAIPALCIVAFNGMAISVTIGIISARFRDIPQVINSVVQILFFVTPLMWKPDALKVHPYVTELNPFYVALDGLDEAYCDHLHEVFDYLASAGAELWWTSMGEIASRCVAAQSQAIAFAEASRP